MHVTRRTVLSIPLYLAAAPMACAWGQERGVTLKVNPYC